MAGESGTAFDGHHFRQRGWWRDETLPGWLARNVERHADSTAVETGAGAISYGDLSARVGKMAAALEQIGIGRGDVVAVHLPNIPEFIVAWLAINARGAIMQTVHLPYGLREIEHLLAHSGAKAAIALGTGKDRSRAEELLSLRDKTTLKTVIAVGPAVDGAENFAALDLERHVLERDGRTIGLADAGDTDNRRRQGTQKATRTPPLSTRPSSGAQASTVHRPSTLRVGRNSGSQSVCLTLKRFSPFRKRSMLPSFRVTSTPNSL